MLPVPENKSKTTVSSKSIRFDNTLNNASFAKSVVGRAGNPTGGFIILPLNFPPIIRNVTLYKVGNTYAGRFAQKAMRQKGVHLLIYN